MNKISDFFKGITTVAEIESPLNGKITVVKSLGLGTYFQVGNLTQSGGVVYGIWKTTLNKVKSMMMEPQKVLILGLGGGSCSKITRKLWPFTGITGVDFDETIVELGKKYLELGTTNTEIIVSDAGEYVASGVAEKNDFNLIIVDLYVGQEFPVAFESDDFLDNVKNILAPNGIAIFNRLYFGEKRLMVRKFGERLEKKFTKVEYFYPEANVMLLCTK